MSITVTGTDVVQKALREAAGKLSGRQMELALAAGGMEIANAAKNNAPVLTGTLRRSIHVGGHTHEGEGADIGGNSPTQVMIGTNLAYAARVEFGFSGMDSLGRDADTPARPYLRPAADEAAPKAMEVIAGAIRDMLEAG